MLNLQEFWHQIDDLYQGSTTDVPVNICVLDENGTAVNFNIDKMYVFHHPSPSGEVQANLVIKPA